MAKPCSLEALSQQVKADLGKLAWPDKEWVPSRSIRTASETADAGRIFDVVIVGGGQCGLSAAFGLMRERVTNVVCLDENEAGKEGPWVTYARMVTLRTPKHLTGPELGLPCLTFQSYYEARFGADAWEKLDKIPKEQWMDYLIWFRQVLEIPVRNGVKVEAIHPLEELPASEQPALERMTVPRRAETTQVVEVPAGETVKKGFRLTLRKSDGTTDFTYARRVVLATGIQGGGEWHIPHIVRESLPKSLYAHTCEPINYEGFKGKRVAIVGGGASAFDNAQHALKLGAGEVHVFVRRKELPRINPIRWMEFSGFLKHFSDLDDATKYAGIDFFLSFNQPPTNDTYTRAARYPNFELHQGCPIAKLEPTADGKQLHLWSAQGDEGLFDFLVVSTGLLTDARLRQELKPFADKIATWADKFQGELPGDTKRNPLIDVHPYLGPSFEFTEKEPGSAPYLQHVYAFNYSALASLGLSASALSGIRFAMPKLIAGITRSLFMEDSSLLLSDYFNYRDEEFVGTWPLVPNASSMPHLLGQSPVPAGATAEKVASCAANGELAHDLKSKAQVTA